MKPRPNGKWFLGPSLMIALAVALLVVMMVLFFKTMMDTDGEVARNGTDHTIRLESLDRRMLWEPLNDAPTDCRIRDTKTSTPLQLSPTLASYSRTVGSTQMQGVATFQPLSRTITVNCTDDGGRAVEIGNAPEFTSLFGGMLAGIVGTFVLGGIGSIWFVVLLILFVSRPKRVA